MGYKSVDKKRFIIINRFTWVLLFNLSIFFYLFFFYKKKARF